MANVDYSVVADQVFEYRFATDSSSGVMIARDFEEAKQMLSDCVSGRVDDGAFGWVEDQDGYRFEIGESC